MKTNKRSIWLIFCIVFSAMICISCGSVKISEENSPHLVNVEIGSYSGGTEDSQYVQIDLIFDQEIAVVSDQCESFRITIAGNRVKEGEYTLEKGEDEKSARIRISVQAITKGVLILEKVKENGVVSEIRSADEKYGVCDFQVEAIIPSGVSLSTVESTAGKVVKSVDSVWNIRSIAWVGVLENGELVKVSEARDLEMLDGYAAVHGHEFLMENETDIAKNMVEILENNYSSEYHFCCDGNQITVEKDDSTAELDLAIYQYKKIDGKIVENAVQNSETAKQSSEEHEDAHDDGENGLKVKHEEADREITSQEQVFLDKLHISNLSDTVDGQITEGTEWYQTLTITGEFMPEEQIYSVRDLEELIQLSFKNQKMNQLNLPVSEDGLYGLNFLEFLVLCGVDLQESNLTLLCENKNGEKEIIEYAKIQKNHEKLWLILAADEGNPQLQEAGLTLLITENGKKELFAGVKKVIVGSGETPQDPEYGYHNRAGYEESKDMEFTIEVYQQGAEYLGAVKTLAFTTEEIEQMMQEYPEAVVQNYYGTIGNEEFFAYMGVGGWLDHFEGINLYWLLINKAGLESLEGRAELVGRDGEVYAEIEDLKYLSDSQDIESYYVITADGVKISGCIPMIACVKNGYPILPEHDHESELYVPYNHMNMALEEKGVVTEIGVIKNHNGPFVACLGNRDGYYGGNQVETGGDCVSIRLYVK